MLPVPGWDIPSGNAGLGFAVHVLSSRHFSRAMAASAAATPCVSSGEHLVGTAPVCRMNESWAAATVIDHAAFSRALSRPKASNASACLSFAFPSFRSLCTLNAMSESLISSSNTYSGSLASCSLASFSVASFLLASFDRAADSAVAALGRGRAA